MKTYLSSTLRNYNLVADPGICGYLLLIYWDSNHKYHNGNNFPVLQPYRYRTSHNGIFTSFQIHRHKTYIKGRNSLQTQNNSPHTAFVLIILYRTLSIWSPILFFGWFDGICWDLFHCYIWHHHGKICK